MISTCEKSVEMARVKMESVVSNQRTWRKPRINKQEEGNQERKKETKL